MGAQALLDALAAQDDGPCLGMTPPERLQAAADGARSLARRANLRYPEAGVRPVDHPDGRGLDRALVVEPATRGFAGRGQGVVLQGPTGTGKTHPACALARSACQRRMRAHCPRRPDLEEALRDARGRPGGERRLVRKHASFRVPVLDERPLDRPDGLFRGFLLELMEARCGTASTVFCAQFRQKDWHARLGGGVHADAVMGRIAHGAARVDMGETNMRRRRAEA